MAGVMVILDRLHPTMVPRQLEVVCMVNLHTTLCRVDSSTELLMTWSKILIWNHEITDQVNVDAREKSIDPHRICGRPKFRHSVYVCSADVGVEALACQPITFITV